MYHIIINPASRSGRGAKIWAEQVEPALKAGNTEYQTYFSGKAGEVRQLAAQITAEHAAEPDLTLIVLGGDGTITRPFRALQILPKSSSATFPPAPAMIWPEIWEFPRIQRLLSI